MPQMLQTDAVDGSTGSWCYPIATTIGIKWTYNANASYGVDSVTVTFGTHTDKDTEVCVDFADIRLFTSTK